MSDPANPPPSTEFDGKPRRSVAKRVLREAAALAIGATVVAALAWLFDQPLSDVPIYVGIAWMGGLIGRGLQRYMVWPDK